MKSQQGFYPRLLSKLLSDMAESVDENSLARDRDYLKSRYATEGLTFFTRILPSFGKAVLHGIESGRFHPPLGFRKSRKGSLLPAFLQGWTKRIFSADLSVLPDINPHDLGEVMQICMLLYKLELPYSHEQEATVVNSFIKTEHEMANPQEDLPLHGNVLDLASSLLDRALNGFNPKDIKPGHGPGAVATGERGNDKYSFRRKYQRLHQEFPYYRYFSPSLSAISFESAWYKHLEPSVLPIAKVCLVPKDSRGPRLISMEPLEIQWIQQGILRRIVPHIEKSSFIRGKINFTSQEKNRQLALEASANKAYCTLDLKEASDRVSLSLFRRIFPKDLVKTFESCRSIATELPDGRILPLSKFAPMGSALCFPVMALTIWALTEATIILKHRKRKHFLVYGDDIIVPTEDVDCVIETLHSAGLLVNNEKSYINSLYRESCGLDAYNGVLVTPVRLRRGIDREQRDSHTYTHLIEFSESLFDRGLWRTCSFIRKSLRDVFGKIPWTHDHTYPGFFCPDISVCDQRNSSFRKRYNSDLQRYEIHLRTVESDRIPSGLQYHSQLLKGLLGLYSESEEDFHVTPRRRCELRRRWCAA